MVGITADTHQMGPDHEPVPALFIPSRVYDNFDVALRTTGDPAALASALERNAAPLAVYGSQVIPDFFSARIGCQTYGVYGTDLAVLCSKRSVP